MGNGAVALAATTSVAAAAVAAAAIFWANDRAARRSRRTNTIDMQSIRPYKLTLGELSGYGGDDPTRPTLLSIRGQIFDVSPRPDMYGPEGNYPFAGKEIARALAKMSVKEEDCSGDLSGLTDEELGILRDWEAKFSEKYECVGELKTS